MFKKWKKKFIAEQLKSATFRMVLDALTGGCIKHDNTVITEDFNAMKAHHKAIGREMGFDSSEVFMLDKVLEDTYFRGVNAALLAVAEMTKSITDAENMFDNLKIKV
jgi:hypothetical protein